ncbi:MAG TPA: signal recognition particle subunit SRP19/SEC65 family protein [Nitrososphaerales archaeon]|nr:signal recognition particle subunit SRP19/SEC65 family protein [Nitrososphaerales archaeon]
MKDYDKYIVWLEYFNSELKRSQGRRVPLSLAIRTPKPEELQEACKRLNLQPALQAGTYPSSGRRESAYVSIRKEKPKQALMLKIAKEISTVRARAPKK